MRGILLGVELSVAALLGKRFVFAFGSATGLESFERLGVAFRLPVFEVGYGSQKVVSWSGV